MTREKARPIPVPRMRRAARAVALAAGAALFLWIGAVSVRRGLALARGRVPLDAFGEAHFMGWAYRDPPLVGRLADAGAQRPPGEAVLAVCVPECDAGWYWVMALYGLPEQAVIGAKTQTEIEGRAVRPTRIERTADRVTARPRRPQAEGTTGKSDATR